MSASIVQAAQNIAGGSWISNPWSVEFDSDLAGGNFLLGFASGNAEDANCYITNIEDTQSNSWVNLDVGQNGYGIGYALTSSSGPDTVDFTGANIGINTHNPNGLALEISGIASYGSMSVTSGTDSVASGSIATPQGDFSFSTTTSYDSWYLTLLYLNGYDDTGLVCAMLYSYNGLEQDVISGWTLSAPTPGSFDTAIYTQVVGGTPPAPVRIFVNAGATRSLASF